ncbi:MAG: hypothetical protein ACK559_06690, partial [bacterium]
LEERVERLVEDVGLRAVRDRADALREPGVPGEKAAGGDGDLPLRGVDLGLADPGQLAAALAVDAGDDREEVERDLAGLPVHLREVALEEAQQPGLVLEQALGDRLEARAEGGA